MKAFQKALVYEFEGSDDLTKMAQEYAEEVSTITATDDYQNVLTAEHLKGVDFFLVGVFDDFKNEYYDLDTLKYICMDWTSQSMFDLDFLSANNVTITNISGQATAGVSELMLNMMLNMMRKTPEAMQYAKDDGESFAEFKGSEIGSKTVAVYGLGSIGQRFAEICEFFGSDIRYHSRSDKEVVYQNVSFAELTNGADVLVVTTEVASDIRNSLGKQFLSGLKENAIILSPGTFEVFNIDELYDVLVERPDIKFWSDVNQSPEWKDCKEKFLALDNVYVTPHSGFFTEENRGRALALTKVNIEKFVNGRV